MRSGVLLRTAIASMLLALVVGVAFGILIHAIENLRGSERQVTHVRQETALADGLEMLVIDLETGARGFVITRQERFLQPWTAARAAIPAQERRLAEIVDQPDQASRVRTITRAIDSYINEYSVPLVNAARQGRAAARSVAVTAEGKLRVDALRAEFGRFQATEGARLSARQRRDDRNAARAATAAGVGLAASVVLILLFGAYLTRAIAVPLRRAAAMAVRLAAGDLTVRVPETGIGEVGALERAFNRMGGSLEASRDELRRLADEQAALRRVATLVAQAVPQSELFGAVAAEVGTLLGADLAGMICYEPDGTVIAVATWAAVGQHVEVAGRWPLDGGDLAVTISSTGRPGRIDDYDVVPGRIAAFIRDELGVSSSVGGPIVVEGRLWGALLVHSKAEPLPRDTESRLASFTELVSTAMSNAHARAEVRRLADEQAALRRVATLVAQTESTSEIFEAVTREVGLLCGADLARMERYEPDGTVTAVAGWSRDGDAQLAVGTRFAVEETSIAARVRETDRPARVDSFAGAPGPVAREARELRIRSSVGCPIVAGGRTWGVIDASSRSESPFPAATESQIGEFTELVATAVSNAQAREESMQLTAEQAALRRIATLVAREAPPADVFTAVADELARLLDADATMIARVDPDGMMTVVARSDGGGAATPLGSRWTLEQPTIVATVVQTGGPVRVDDDSGDSGAFGDAFHSTGIGSSVATPVLVAGRLWGATIVATQSEPLAGDAEQRMADFTELVATAIANADGRAQLVASRARLLSAGDDARRRVVRDLHDGAQQRLVTTIMALKLARDAARDGEESVDALIADALEQAEQANAELRELAHGLLPPVLARGGLRAGVDALVSRLRVPVHVAVLGERLPREIEASAYFVVAEALTNVVKHSGARSAVIKAWVEGGVLHVDVRDDGAGGARADGTGLLGLQDRLAALGGRLRVESPADGGTRIAATLPL